jgi:hypothetical protein
LYFRNAVSLFTSSTIKCLHFNSRSATKNNPESLKILAEQRNEPVNKWLKAFIPKECSVHSFRHSMRDRLRAVECPKEIIDQIGGWSSGDVGESYGDGFPLDNLNKWLSYITINH